MIDIYFFNNNLNLLFDFFGIICIIVTLLSIYFFQKDYQETSEISSLIFCLFHFILFLICQCSFLIQYIK